MCVRCVQTTASQRWQQDKDRWVVGAKCRLGSAPTTAPAESLCGPRTFASDDWVGPQTTDLTRCDGFITPFRYQLPFLVRVRVHRLAHAPFEPRDWRPTYSKDESFYKLTQSYENSFPQADSMYNPALGHWGALWMDFTLLSSWGLALNPILCSRNIYSLMNWMLNIYMYIISRLSNLRPLNKELG